MNTPSNSPPTSSEDVKRGPNQEAVDTAQENATQGFGSAGKASIISGKPDGDTQGGPGRNNDQAQAPSKT
jgi:hypothetical protein